LFFDRGNGDPGHNRVWGRDSLNPRWIELVRRSPVNVNTAPREVLMALVTDLEGFLLVERRRDLLPSGRGAVSSSPCGSPGSAYSWTSLRYRYDGRDDSGDECGLLYRTVPFTGPGGRSPDGIPAATVVEEILACRERKPSPGSTTVPSPSAARSAAGPSSTCSSTRSSTADSSSIAAPATSGTWTAPA